MSQLDHVLDDALAGFDDDDGFTFASSSGAGGSQAAVPPTSVHTSSAMPSAAAGPSTSYIVQTALSSQAAASSTSSSTAGQSSQPSAVPAPPSSSKPSTSSSKPFDPLKRKPRGKSTGLPAAAGLSGSSLGSSSSSSSSKRPALTPEVHKLQEDLAKLMSEWSTAMHPEAEQPAQPAPGQQRGVSAVLAALAEQTQRTVEEQSKLRPPPAGPAAAAGSSGGAGGGEQMNMIVDVVMQHLLSKDVLYQPMKEIMDKYPPWLEKHTAPGSSTTLSPDDLERYKHQYACITRLCEAYEREPDNTAKIMELLQEMQACGEPPADIVDEMSAAIAADLPAGAAGGEALDNLEGLEGLGELPPELRNCPVQ